jgi:hypothetical protein
MRPYQEFHDQYFPAIDKLCQDLVSNDGWALIIASHAMYELESSYSTFSNEVDALAAVFNKARTDCLKHLKMLPKREYDKFVLLEKQLDMNIWQRAYYYVLARWKMSYRIAKAWLRGDLHHSISQRQK